MDTLNNNELFSIAILLDLKDLLNFSVTNKKIYHSIYENDDIWYYLLNKDYPKWKTFNIPYNSQKCLYKKLYEFLKDMKKLKKELSEDIKAIKMIFN